MSDDTQLMTALSMQLQKCRADRDALRADKERLDWLERQGKHHLSPLWGQDWVHLRNAIDTAMKGQP